MAAREIGQLSMVASLREIRLAADALEALQTKQHDLAEKMLLRSLG